MDLLLVLQSLCVLLELCDYKIRKFCNACSDGMVYIYFCFCRRCKFEMWNDDTIFYISIIVVISYFKSQLRCCLYKPIRTLCDVFIGISPNCAIKDVETRMKSPHSFSLKFNFRLPIIICDNRIIPFTIITYHCVNTTIVCKTSLGQGHPPPVNSLREETFGWVAYCDALLYFCKTINHFSYES